MKDPLTKKERKEFINEFIMKFNANYERALISGALDEEEVGSKGNHMVATSVLKITAEEYRLVSKEGKETLNNLRHFL